MTLNKYHHMTLKQNKNGSNNFKYDDQDDLDWRAKTF